MAEEIKPTVETTAQPVQSAAASVPNTSNITPQVPAEPVAEEVFDKDRAMKTITALRDVEKQAKLDKKELERLKADEKTRLDAQLTETERLTKQAAELAEVNAKLQADILRRDVVAETGLPAVLADRLKGATKEEMLADAKLLLSILPQSQTQEKPKAPHLNSTNPGTVSIMSDEARREFLGLRR